jgi:hypothetical protein
MGGRGGWYRLGLVVQLATCLHLPMRQQPGGHVSMPHTALPEAQVCPVDCGSGGMGRVQDHAGVAVEQRVGLDGLVRLWSLSCCCCHG